MVIFDKFITCAAQWRPQKKRARRKISLVHILLNVMNAGKLCEEDDFSLWSFPNNPRTFIPKAQTHALIQKETIFYVI